MFALERQHGPFDSVTLIRKPFVCHNSTVVSTNPLIFEIILTKGEKTYKISGGDNEAQCHEFVGTALSDNLIAEDIEYFEYNDNGDGKCFIGNPYTSKYFKDFDNSNWNSTGSFDFKCKNKLVKYCIGSTEEGWYPHEVRVLIDDAVIFKAYLDCRAP